MCCALKVVKAVVVIGPKADDKKEAQKPAVAPKPQVRGFCAVQVLTTLKDREHPVRGLWFWWYSRRSMASMHYS